MHIFMFFGALFALAFYGVIFWAIIEFIRYLRRK